MEEIWERGRGWKFRPTLAKDFTWVGLPCQLHLVVGDLESRFSFGE